MTLNPVVSDDFPFWSWLPLSWSSLSDMMCVSLFCFSCRVYVSLEEYLLVGAQEEDPLEFPLSILSWVTNCLMKEKTTKRRRVSDSFLWVLLWSSCLFSSSFLFFFLCKNCYIFLSSLLRSEMQLMHKCNHFVWQTKCHKIPSDLLPFSLLLNTATTFSTGFSLSLSLLSSQVLPMTAEEVIMLSQKESLISSANAYGSLDKNNTIVGGVNLSQREESLMTSAPTDLDLYTSHALAAHLHHHQHHHHHLAHHNHLNSQNNSPQPGLTVTTSSSSATSSGTTTSSSHPHVHFLPHQIQMLDGNDSLLDPSIVTSVGGNNHTNSGTATLSRNTQYLKS